MNVVELPTEALVGRGFMPAGHVLSIGQGLFPDLKLLLKLFLFLQIPIFLALIFDLFNLLHHIFLYGELGDVSVDFEEDVDLMADLIRENVIF